MQHLYLLYLFITVLIGVASLSVVTADYLRTKEKLLRSYINYLAALTVLVLTKLLFLYVSLNPFGLQAAIAGGLEYLHIFVAKYALMITFPPFIHDFFDIPQAKKRNFVFWGLALFLCITEHVLEFGFQGEPIEKFADNIDNLVLMLVFFYGLVTGIAEYRQCAPEKSGLAKYFLILLGISMPAIMVDTLLPQDSLPAPLYPIIYCTFSIYFTRHLVQYVFSQREKPALFFRPVVESVPGSAERPLPAELCRPFHLSPREQEVFQLLVQGSSNTQIAETLFISLSTVKAHLQHIYTKFDVNNRYELIALLKHGDGALLPRPSADDDK